MKYQELMKYSLEDVLFRGIIPDSVVLCDGQIEGNMAKSIITCNLLYNYATSIVLQLQWALPGRQPAQLQLLRPLQAVAQSIDWFGERFGLHFFMLHMA